MAYNKHMIQNSTWQETEQGLYKRFEFKDFKAAFGFMEMVAAHAEEQQHHPCWTNEWNKVDVWLVTHESGDTITQKDRAMALAIDSLVAENQS
jgi:4a-hydroxytetrahydrobiopterin dehydratase